MLEQKAQARPNNGGSLFNEDDVVFNFDGTNPSQNNQNQYGSMGGSGDRQQQFDIFSTPSQNQT
jgi:hypothetical protein